MSSIRFSVIPILVLTFLSAASLWAWPGEVLVSIPLPMTEPGPVCFVDDTTFWVGDLARDSLWQVSAFGTAIPWLRVPGTSQAGYCRVGDTLWILDSRSSLARALVAGTVRDSISLGGRTLRGWSRQGGTFWATCPDNRTVYRFNRDGTVRDSFPAPFASPRGICWDGSALVSLDIGKDAVIWGDTLGLAWYTMPSPAGYPYGIDISSDGTRLAVTDYTDRILTILDNRLPANPVRVDSLTADLIYLDATEVLSGGMTDWLCRFTMPRNELSHTFTDLRWFGPGPFTDATDSFGVPVRVTSASGTGSCQLIAGWRARVTSYTTQAFLRPNRVGDWSELPPDTVARYTRTNARYDTGDPLVDSLVQALVPSGTGYYDAVRCLHDAVLGRIVYQIDDTDLTGNEVLRYGIGSCAEYAYAFLALARRAGIPSRWVTGIRLRNAFPYRDSLFHRWPEVWFPRYGWLPVDPTLDDDPRSGGQVEAFGSLSRNTFAVAAFPGPSDLTGWEGKSLHVWHTDPPGEVAFHRQGWWLASDSPWLLVTWPLGRRILSPGTSMVPRWLCSTGLTGAVQLAFSTDNGGTWLGQGLFSGDSALWTVPDLPTDRGRLRITDPASSTQALNDTTFVIGSGTGVPTVPIVLSDRFLLIHSGRRLHLRLSGERDVAGATLRVYDCLGHLILCQVAKEEGASWPLPRLGAGIYVGVVRFPDGGEVTGRFAVRSP